MFLAWQAHPRIAGVDGEGQRYAIASIGEPMWLHSQTVRVGLFIGIACFLPMAMTPRS